MLMMPRLLLLMALRVADVYHVVGDMRHDDYAFIARGDDIVDMMRVTSARYRHHALSGSMRYYMLILLVTRRCYADPRTPLR